MKRVSKLSLRFFLGCVLLGALICFSTCVVGYFQYRDSIRSQYSAQAYSTAEVAASYVSGENLHRYVQLVTGYHDGTVTEAEIAAVSESGAYQQASRQMNDLQVAMGASDIMVFVLDEEELLSYNGTRENWEPLLYIFDNNDNASLSYRIGDRGSFKPEFIEDLYRIGTTGQRVDNYFFSKGEYGYNTSAILPLLDEDGSVLAIVAVEMPMATLNARLARYMIASILTTVVITLTFVLLYMVYLYRRVVRPVEAVTRATAQFAEDHTRLSTELEQVRTKDEIQTLAASVLKMETDLNRYIDDLTRITAEKERVSAELNVAAKIQSDMLPRVFPAFPEREEFDIYASMDPAKEVGGDFYDFFLVDKDHLALVIADVSGKGVPAALFMMISKTLIKNAAQSGLSPKEVLEKVNNQLCENNDAEMFVTVWLGILEISSGRMICANAGHEFPAIRRKDGRFALYQDRHGFVLAGMENMRYKEYELQLSAGDALFVYTDGVPEATNGDNVLFGADRMLEALNVCPDSTGQQLLWNVRGAIDYFVGSAPQFDDITMLALTITDPPAQQPGAVRIASAGARAAMEGWQGGKNAGK